MDKNDVPSEVRNAINSYKAQFYTKGSIIRSIHNKTISKDDARKYVEIVLNENKRDDIEEPTRVLKRAKNSIKLAGILVLIGFGIAIISPRSAGYAFLGAIVYTLISVIQYIKFRMISV